MAQGFLVISKWIVALLSGTLVGLIVAELINGDLNLALIHGFGIYMIDMTWITVYNYVCGVKIGEKGLIVGVDFIEWSDVELYAVNHNPKKSWNRFRKPGLRLLIREIGSLRPIWISVNDSNSGLVLSLIKEYMIQ